MNFDTTIERRGDDVVLHVAGEFDLYSAPEFKAELAAVIATGACTVVVDLMETTFLDSTALGALVGGLKRLRADGGELSLVCSDRSILRLFEITGLDRVFTIQRTPTATLPLLTVSAS